MQSFFIQEVYKKMIFTWDFWDFFDIQGLGKYGFWFSVCWVDSQIKIQPKLKMECEEKTLEMIKKG